MSGLSRARSTVWPEEEKGNKRQRQGPLAAGSQQQLQQPQQPQQPQQNSRDEEKGEDEVPSSQASTLSLPSDFVVEKMAKPTKEKKQEEEMIEHSTDAEGIEAYNAQF